MRLATVIASYNHAQYIVPAIESVLNQSRPTDRFLVIDDGSKDDSVEVIRQFEDRGVELIVQENAGAHATWNRCIEEVSKDCDLVSILNSDDIYEPTRFEKCVPQFEQPEAKAVVSTGLHMIDSEGDLLSPEESRAKWLRAVWAMGRESDAEAWEWMAMANFVVTSSNIITRTDYALANPFQPYRFNHDYFFLSGAALRDQIHLIDEDLLEYRVHPQNNINTDPAPLLKEMLRMHFDLYHHFADEFTADAATRSRFYEYMRAIENSVSSFHSGLFQLLLAQLSAKATPEEIEAMVNGLDEESLLELHDYPNKALVNTWDETSAPQAATNLAGKYEAVREENRKLKAERDAWRDLARARNELLRSKGFALSRLFGGGKREVSDAGKSPQEKLRNLQGE
ncbi:MAG: glycosyltransferase family 2 protein [Verrucomicrobiales bacterium]|nr:glycosyltransferase family 2 protein [Verrucomicrobiales bacterium]